MSEEQKDAGAEPKGKAIYGWRERGSSEPWDYTLVAPQDHDLHLCEVFVALPGSWTEVTEPRS